MSVHSKLGDLGSALGSFIDAFMSSDKVEAKLDQATKAVHKAAKKHSNADS